MKELNLSDALIEAFAGKKVKWLFGGHPVQTANGDVVIGHRIDLRFANVRAVPIAVNYSDVKKSALPDSVIVKESVNVNCDDLPMQVNDSIGLIFTEGYQIQKTTSVTSGKQVTNTVGIQIPVVSATLGVSQQVSVNYTETDSNSSNNQTQKSETRAITKEVPGKSVFICRMEKRISTDYVEFSGTLQLDGDVEIIAFQLSKGVFTGLSVPAGKISDYLSTAEATVAVEGQIWNVWADRTVRTDNVVPVASQPGACQPPTVQNFNGESEAAFTRLFDVGNLDTDHPGVLVTESLISGGFITTGNSIGNVEVRAQSLGPGFCACTISSANGLASVLAPPLTWSPWTTLFSHFGSVSTSLTVSAICDTGVLAEVKYYKAV
ncbi:hypothetical protein [Rhizobium leguminosarum]|uniref:hypothetical protein n=1 Tax=Rhizobium leguminosarum TaxID=384 RepID=UPI001C91BFB0|nr:hypothetical protein [Rhizobium leguminosarum]MBY3044844.1 hypothetical protein [Rhizobium leguminosarum]